jgi:GT2 family glycosyltransferase
MSNARTTEREQIEADPRPPVVSVSVVTYGSDVGHLGRALASLASAVADFGEGLKPDVHLILVDNGPVDEQRSAALGAALSNWRGGCDLIAGHGNIGYGRGHNLAIQRADSRFHLILNPDVEIASDVLRYGLGFFRENPDCGVIAGAVRG